jgi:hypothetical protein
MNGNLFPALKYNSEVFLLLHRWMDFAGNNRKTEKITTIKQQPQRVHCAFEVGGYL